MSENKNEKNWFQRNWKWFVPVSGCLGIILFFVLGIGALFFGVTSMLSESTPAQYAIELASKNEKVIGFLGTSIEKEGFPTGKISTGNSTGKADLVIKIKGSKGSGTLFIKAEKRYEEWVYEELYVLIKETQEKVHLLEKTLEGI